MDLDRVFRKLPIEKDNLFRIYGPGRRRVRVGPCIPVLSKNITLVADLLDEMHLSTHRSRSWTTFSTVWLYIYLCTSMFSPDMELFLFVVKSDLNKEDIIVSL